MFLYIDQPLTCTGYRAGAEIESEAKFVKQRHLPPQISQRPDLILSQQIQKLLGSGIERRMRLALRQAERQQRHHRK